MKVYSYNFYLNSSQWEWKRNLTLKYKGKKCRICGSEKFIQIHHKRYKNSKGSILGRETLGDLIPLCASCHQTWHSIHSHKTHLSSRIVKNIKILFALGGQKSDAFLIGIDSNKVNHILQLIKPQDTVADASS